MKKSCVVVDIDGTLSDLTHRLHYIQQEKKDWDSFFAEVRWDSLNERMQELVAAISRDYHIVLCSGRPEKCRSETIGWLNENYVPFHKLFMRKDGDRREDYLIKEEILKTQLKDYTIIAAIDDRKQVVDMWRRNGIMCLQCAEGNF